ncbi:hypothetical protein F4777DRAFT_593239 [Nemania sp. FL0916]|nr:hypothetical protein F4777DRAFT_593239 [Nemania sp. FL0916]
MEHNTSPAYDPGENVSQDMASTVSTTPGSSVAPSTCQSVRNICCIGAGYVGGPTGAVIAYHNPGIRVTVVNSDEQRIRRWNSRHLPIHEVGLHPIGMSISSGERDQVEQGDPKTTEVHARAPNLFFSVQIQECIAKAEIILIAVNTPTKASSVGTEWPIDLTAFETVAHEVARYAQAGTIIVEKSTLPCRTAQVFQGILASHRPGVHFEVLSNPEFLAAGTAVHNLMQPDRVLIGSSQTSSGRHAAAVLADVYAAWVPRSRIITTHVWSSELSKLVANAMLAQRISSINSVSAICDAVGADIGEVAVSVGSDHRIGDKFLQAGIGFGGSCLKKDVLSLVYLAESLGLPDVGEYWRQVVTMNDSQRNRFCHLVAQCLDYTLVDKKVTVLGFAFKANTSDTRESRTMEIVRVLLHGTPREIAIFDPCCCPKAMRDEIEMILPEANRRPVVVYSNVYEACAGSHAILITTDCDEFCNTKLPALRNIEHCTPSEHDGPGPYARAAPSEMDPLALYDYLLRSSSRPLQKEGDPLELFVDEPACADGCPDCELGDTIRGMGKVDWRQISSGMREPKWLFDGKGIIDPDEMARLGIRVESIGRQANI